MRKLYNTIVILLVVAAAVACGWEDPLAGLAGPAHEVVKQKTRGFTLAATLK
jgi:predicted small lipoprotein YifL